MDDMTMNHMSMDDMTADDLPADGVGASPVDDAAIADMAADKDDDDDLTEQDTTVFLQIMGSVLREYRATNMFRKVMRHSGIYWDRAAEERRSAESAALLEIAACLREDVEDFVCIDHIVEILESLGYDTGSRHDFG